MRRLTHRTAGSVRLTLLLALALSCAKARTDVVGAPRCVSWKQEIGSMFAERCGSCHAGAAPAGGYATGSYAGVLGGGSDAVPNATAGDPGSRLLVTIDPLTADTTHRAVSDLFPTVRSWVVDCGLSFVRSSIHRGGILDPASDEFHGKLIRGQKYDLGVCQQCHGSDFAGGTSTVSCLGCHAQGPTACSTCHGAIATQGSHAAHLGGGPLAKTFACGECHVVPLAYTDAGHIFRADGTLDPPPAEVALGATAALTPAGGGARLAPPSFDPATQECSNVYCHGAALGDGASTNTHPVWNAPGTGQADCGTCHGLPPNHGGASIEASSGACVACHPSVVDKDRKVTQPDRHVDGKVDFGVAASGCTGCHGGMRGPAPPRGLTGETSPAAAGVGAHRAHMIGASHLRGPIACNECHRVPTDVSTSGHFGGHRIGGGGGVVGGDIDVNDGAEVFAADPTVGVLASSGGAAPRWDHPTATCAGVYCHGAGTALAADTTVGIDRAPVWTAPGALTCGTACHGLPPAFSPHTPGMTLLDCAICHPRTVDPAGIVIISGAAGAEISAHINGALDVAN